MDRLFDTFMKKYIIITSLFLSCSRRERTPSNYTFNASKDTSFIVERTSPMALRVEYDIEGQLQDSSILIISYYKSKLNPNSKLEIPLGSGGINMKSRTYDFYDGNASALFTFKHLNNKKGKLTIKASL
jgi:hypothetical protein